MIPARDPKHEKKAICEPKCWFFIAFIRKTWFWSSKCCQNHGFYNIFENKSSVAAEPCFGLPPFSCHSNFFFEKAVKPMLLATFCVNAESMELRVPLLALYSARTPTVWRHVWGKFKIWPPPRPNFEFCREPDATTATDPATQRPSDNARRGVQQNILV